MDALFDSGVGSARLDALVAQRPHDVWRGDRMATCRTTVLASGYAALDAELPDRGWPHSTLIELLPQQPGIGEMQLLRPALASIAKQRRVALIQPPYMPHSASWQNWGLPLASLFWLDAARSADALWSAEQILRSGCFGALVVWQTQIRPEALRRLHLAAHAADTLFWMVRPESVGRETSPAPLRLTLRPANAGITIHVVKRRGPQSVQPFFLALSGVAGGVPGATPGSIPASSSPPAVPRHGLLDRRTPTAAVARDISPALV